MENNVVTQSYNWLTHALGELPTLTKQQKLEAADLVLKLLAEEIKEYKDAITDGDALEELNACADLLVVASNLPFFSGIKEEDLTWELTATYESNMTKFCDSEEEAQATVKAYAEGTHPNKLGVKIKTYYKEQHGKYVIFHTEDNKVLKARTFQDTKNFR